MKKIKYQNEEAILSRVKFWSEVQGIDKYFDSLSQYDKMSLAQLLDNQVAYAPDDTMHNEDLKTMATEIYGTKAVKVFEKAESYGSGVLIAVCTAFKVFKNYGAYIYVQSTPSENLKVAKRSSTLKNQSILFRDVFDDATDDNNVPFLAINTMFVNNCGNVSTVGDIFKVNKNNKYLKMYK